MQRRLPKNNKPAPESAVLSTAHGSLSSLGQCTSFLCHWPVQQWGHWNNMAFFCRDQVNYEHTRQWGKKRALSAPHTHTHTQWLRHFCSWMLWRLGNVAHNGFIQMTGASIQKSLHCCYALFPTEEQQTGHREQGLNKDSGKKRLDGK